METLGRTECSCSLLGGPLLGSPGAGQLLDGLQWLGTQMLRDVQRPRAVLQLPGSSWVL